MKIRIILKNIQPANILNSASRTSEIVLFLHDDCDINWSETNDAHTYQLKIIAKFKGFIL